MINEKSIKWIQLKEDVHWNDQAASTSTITMNHDFTAIIQKGMAIKFKLSGSYYYAICSNIASALLTIAGAPLTTGDGDLEELYYSPFTNQVEELRFTVTGSYADGATSTLLEADLKIKGGYAWKKPKAYCVNQAVIHTADDTGTPVTEPTVTAMINSAALLSSEDEVATTLQNSVVEITTANYDINYEETIEIKVTQASGGAPNNDASDLTVFLTFVYE